MESLTKEKFNWMIEFCIYFNPPHLNKNKTISYLSVLCLIHPSHKDIWIVYSLKHDKKTDEWVLEYKMYYGTESKEFLTLKELNLYLKKNGYGGRKLVAEDFVKQNEKE